MNAQIRDESVLKTLAPTSVVGYLKSRQWQLVGKLKADVPVYSKGDYQVFLPLNKGYADYGLRMGEVLAALSAEEGRSQLTIFEELVFSAADRVRFRLMAPLAKRGQLPINLGVRFFERARDVIYAAACSAVEPKAFYQGRRHQKAEEYMSKVYLGQTERGSFVVNVGSPIAPPVEALDPEEEPFERQVTHRLIRSVSAARDAAYDVAMSTNADPFLDAMATGVSANLCTALSELFLEQDQGKLEISLQWSPLRPRPSVADSVISLDAGLAPIFAEASRSLRTRAPREEFLAEGWITKLEREVEQNLGRAAVYAPVDGALRRINVVLDAEDYDLATEAHARRLPVALEGELVRQGRGYALKHPRNLRITDSPEESTDPQMYLE